MSDHNATMTKDRSSLEEIVRGTGFDEAFMQDGMDYSLFTVEEMRLLGKLQKEHERRLEKRATELRFSPENGLTLQERIATMRCMTSEELKPLFVCGALYEKCKRMTKELSFVEKVDVRIFGQFTVHFSELGPAFKEIRYDDVFVWAQLYQEIMKKHGLQLFEEPYSFLSRDEKMRMLEAGSKLSPEEYMTEEELEEARGKEKNMADSGMGEGVKRDNTVLGREDSG
ncbi:MAG: hypothetical protein QG670_2897 [Thermoproteota archaeon]|nr:hypothetical protein [Thermoproteota archaeon]